MASNEWYKKPGQVLQQVVARAVTLAMQIGAAWQTKGAPGETQDSFAQKYAEAMGQVVKPTILVCGYTGSGKTTLIQAICGKDTVPDDRIGHGKPMTQAFIQYRNAFINLWDSKGLEPGEQEATFLQNTQGLVAHLQADPDPRNHIHLVWYTIQGPGARVTATDLALIRNVFPNVIVVITKADITRPQQHAAIRAELLHNGVSSEQIVAVAEDDTVSLQALVTLTMQSLPQAYRDAFLSAQLVDLASKQARAQSVIHSAAASAAAIGAVPIPFSDALLITPIQFTMIAALAVVYGLPTEGVRVSATPFIAEVVGVMSASSLTKLVPGFGSVIQSGMAFALTEVIGQLVGNWMARCCAARVQGQPMPPFQLPLEDVGQLLKGYPR